ncbi:MAG: ribonuclease J [Clostridiales bacterium]|nr:ribonuclease J [Clostridiales bacterium]
MADRKPSLKVVSLGGLGEIGKNMTVLEYGDDIIIIDCGVAFPEDDMLGIDLVIPDYSYLTKNRDRVKALFLTHGHEDHIGSIPYFLKEMNVPIYATKLTLGLVDNKLKEHDVKAESYCILPGETVKAGCFEVEFIRTTHSIADSVAFAIKTPVGIIVHSGDFKIDYTPIQGEAMDLQRFAELGKEGVLLFLCESTNVEQKGYTMSERTVGSIFEQIFDDSEDSRIIVATFSSNIHRIQQVINSAHKHNRKVVIIGRSMNNAAKTAIELGYLTVPENIMIEPSELKNYTPEQLTIITTGSQGEPMAALSRMAASDHRQVEINQLDKIIISASPIPGNEKLISKVINELMKKGADVLYEGLMEVHVSGHAKQEEIKLMHALVKPKYLMPIHGEYKHLKQHKELAKNMGMPKENIFLMSNGEVLEISRDNAKVVNSVHSGHILVDGLGVGDVGNIVLKDRRHLSQDGLMIVVISVDKEISEIVAGPEIISRGFVYVREAEDLLDEAKNVVSEALDRCSWRKNTEWSLIKAAIKESLREFVWLKTKRSPMILPIIMEV